MIPGFKKRSILIAFFNSSGRCRFDFDTYFKRCKMIDVQQKDRQASRTDQEHRESAFVVLVGREWELEMHCCWLLDISWTNQLVDSQLTDQL